MKVYLDENNICHKDFKDGYREAEHPFFDTVPETAIDCYKFVPEQCFIQCVDSYRERIISKQYQASEEKYGKVLYDIAIQIGALTKESNND